MPRYHAQIDNFLIEYETIQDNFEKSIPEYSYPKQELPDTDDMGLKRSEFQIRCYFCNENFGNYKEFIAYFRQQRDDLTEFIHPDYGLLFGRIKVCSVRHDDKEETAEVDIIFVESQAQQTVTVLMEVESAVENSFASGQAEAMEYFEDEVKNTIGYNSGEVLAQELDPDTRLANQLPKASWSAKQYLIQLDEGLRQMDRLFANYANPDNTLLANLDFGLELPGRIMKTIARLLERISISKADLQSAPVMYLRSLIKAYQDLEFSFSLFADDIRIAGSQRVLLEAGYLYKIDEENRDLIRQNEDVPAFDNEGNYLKSSDSLPEIMTVNDLESSLYIIREYAQSAIDIRRQLRSHRDMCRALLQHVDKVKLEREKIIQVDVNNPTPLVLVLHANDLPYTMLERVLAINPDIENPNFVQGSVNVYAA